MVEQRRDSDGAKMDNYERVDLTLRYRLYHHYRPYVRVENLFDEDYEEIPGFGTPGFSVFGGMELAL